MRIVSGLYKSRSLKTLKGDNTRPTSDKIRGAIFDSIAFDGHYETILDLFSGSGAIGLEALSRGFKEAIFNDKSRDAVKVIKDNIKSLKVETQSRVYNLDYRKCLNLLKEKNFDLIFIDPPYDQVNLIEILDLIRKNELLSDTGIIIIEGSSQLDLSAEIMDLECYKAKDYKATKLMYYRKK